MAKPIGNNFVLLDCPVCQGTGFVVPTGAAEGREKCRRCNEKGVYAWLEGTILSWNKKVDALHIFEEEMERTIKTEKEE
ncbi:MAG: hypothetical protein V1685_02955, partial [Parcubacteria group bacterium]